MSVRRKHIRALVNQLLTRHGIMDAAVPVEDIAKSSGIEVRHDSIEDADVSGFLFRDKEHQRVIIGVNSTQIEERKRFTIAHELGHFLLHEGQPLHVDHNFRVNLRSGKSSEGTDIEEKEANFFAAELLMPKSFLEKDLSDIDAVDLFVDLDALQELAKKYKISPQALTYRLTNLGYMVL